MFLLEISCPEAAFLVIDVLSTKLDAMHDDFMSTTQILIIIWVVLSIELDVMDDDFISTTQICHNLDQGVASFVVLNIK